MTTYRLEISTEILECLADPGFRSLFECALPDKGDPEIAAHATVCPDCGQMLKALAAGIIADALHHDVPLLDFTPEQKEVFTLAWIQAHSDAHAALCAEIDRLAAQGIDRGRFEIPAHYTIEIPDASQVGADN